MITTVPMDNILKHGYTIEYLAEVFGRIYYRKIESYCVDSVSVWSGEVL